MDEKLIELCKRSYDVKYEIEKLTTEKKNEALMLVADKLIKRADEIISANDIDIKNGIEKGMNEGLLDRLKLTKERIDGIAEGVRLVAALPDPIGEILDETSVKSGLKIRKIRVPMGVIGIIYESRPNVTADAFSLCFKSGNAVILKGGSDALNSNKMITAVIRDALSELGISPDAILLIESTDREVTKEFMKMKQYVDLLIPRGGAGLIKSVVENSLIPVIETGTGNCHIFVDKSADLNKAVDVILNAKTQRIGVCNAMESLVVHKDIVNEFMPVLAKALKEKNVEIRADEP
ncbi:MAG: glutamate-5-semialdehyde dehydrogenase, partial [Lachnospiraceae bacterium]|nr:glutamate-5-semialdehyde dehydrogenase [Lachnospiraceae bacterium]